MRRFMYIELVPWMFVLLPIINSSQSAHGACPQKCTCATDQGSISCQNAGLRHIPWDLPAPMEITKLDLSHNEISDVNAQIIYPNLEVLDLSSNQIYRIEENRIGVLTQLKSLVLKDNQIKNLQLDTFAGLKQLEHLDLSDNDLRNLTSPIFRSLDNLAKLTLLGNVIENVSSVAFEGLGSLKELDLEDNRISVIKPSSFVRLSSLTTLNLRYNRLRYVTGGAFSHLPMLEEIVLESNGITEIADSAFLSESSDEVIQVKTVKLENNMLYTIPSGLFSTLNHLETLDLSQNPISKITDGAFLGLANLRSLQLNSMPLLQTIYNDAFEGLETMRKLEMNSNPKLSAIDIGAFPVTSQLKILDLHANALSSLSENLVDWTSLKFLDLRYNYWNCDCKLSWLPETLTSLSNNMSLHMTQDVKCQYPLELATTPVMSLEGQLSECLFDELVTVSPQFQDNIMIAIMCSIGGVLVIVIVILVCKYGKSYSTAYAPAMDQYVYRNPNKVKNGDVEKNPKVPVIESDSSMSQKTLRSSLSSSSGLGMAKPERKLTRVRFADAGSNES